MSQDRAAEIAAFWYPPSSDRYFPHDAESRQELADQIRAALAAAREEGRRAGLEEAAQYHLRKALVHSRDAIWQEASDLGGLLEPHNGPAISVRREQAYALDIRALADKEPT